MTKWSCKLFEEWIDWCKWYYDENHISPIETILKHKQVFCMRRKMPFTFFK